MSTLTLEPRDAGVLELDDLEVEFVGEPAGSPFHEVHACATSCNATLNPWTATLHHCDASYK
jgi:hypothetical protein